MAKIRLVYADGGKSWWQTARVVEQNSTTIVLQASFGRFFRKKTIVGAELSTDLYERRARFTEARFVSFGNTFRQNWTVDLRWARDMPVEPYAKQMLVADVIANMRRSAK